MRCLVTYLDLRSRNARRLRVLTDARGNVITAQSDQELVEIARQRGLNVVGQWRSSFRRRSRR